MIMIYPLNQEKETRKKKVYDLDSMSKNSNCNIHERLVPIMQSVQVSSVCIRLKLLL